MTLKNYIVAALFICGAAWLWGTGTRQAGAEKQAIASQYHLGAQQLTVYDKCMDAMENKGIRAGGSKQQFCGCLVQRGLGDLPPGEADTVVGWIKNRSPRPNMITDGQGRVLEAAVACVDDNRTTWTSVAAMQSWCAEKDARRSLPQCKLELK